MGLLKDIGRRIAMLAGGRRFERDLDDEMRLHLELETARQVERGLSPADAPFAARRAFGRALALKEDCRDAWGWRWLDDIRQDVRYALRGLRQKPAFTMVAVASLALGIGFNTAVFGFLNTLLLAKLPVRDPDHLYQLIVTHRTATHNRFSYPDFEKLRANFDVIDSLAVWGVSDFDVDTGNGKTRAHTAFVSDALLWRESLSCGGPIIHTFAAMFPCWDRRAGLEK